MEQIHPLPSTDEPVLRFSLPEGQVANEFLREGPVAAHLLLTSGMEPRLLAAFPAGNSATGLWFKPDAAPLSWSGAGQLQAVQSRDGQGRPLYGVGADLGADRNRLTVSAAVLSSARVLRDYQHDGRLPLGMHNAVHFSADSVRWSRDRIDGSVGYAIVLQVLNGSVSTDAHGCIMLCAAPGQTLRLRLTALTGETALRPLPADQLLRAPEAGAWRARQSLAFLSYRDKLLAGSWRFNTYFGRDTLMSLLLLMPALTPQAIEAGLLSVLGRLDPQGAVAHEEDIGEWALLHGSGGAPVYDYKMVDDDFMLAPAAMAYLLEHAGAPEAARWLAEPGALGEPHGAALARNFRRVRRLASAYARQPDVANLIHLRPGQLTGDWRDSADGLGGGVVSYNVNAILVPAALRAIAALQASGLLAPYLEPDAAVGTLAQLWETRVPAYFAVRRDAAAVRDNVRRCAGELGVDPAPALASLDDEELCFSAIALDAQHLPVPVLHSDLGFALLLQQPPADLIERELRAIMRPFPAGLMTGVGLVVANGAHADAALRALFGPDRYHGAVVWSWQQALLAAGLARQLARTDLPAATRALLAAAQDTLWAAIQATQAQSNSELWSWTWEDGEYRMRPFGPGAATADEANAVQLWSTVYLAVQPPAAASTMSA
ncbi:hypothetical protein FHW83_001063 [Duganella sp. SG902]|uniref:hypothetical protein n=1 Tax=Duganella sp. SG902 TaxID=2587016 RepID=UPI00159D834C|nr:hypothetical protein [Duganella sp. SG902]NVM75283.1 hypothetical protein [Duganella sp. SG902]